MSEFLFTSESVSEGHPDKVADQISDAVLDAILAKDTRGRVAAETLVTTGLVVMAGEITTSAFDIDFQQVARDTIKSIGYDNTEYGIDYKGCAVMVCYDKQSPDIAQGVDEGKGIDLDRPVTTSCGSGVTASTLALALYMLGRKDVPVYDGSWSEWGARPEVPVAIL